MFRASQHLRNKTTTNVVTNTLNNNNKRFLTSTTKKRNNIVMNMKNKEKKQMQQKLPYGKRNKQFSTTKTFQEIFNKISANTNFQLQKNVFSQQNKHFHSSSAVASPPRREDSISQWLVDRENLINATRKFLPVLTDRGRFSYAEAWAINEEQTGLRVYDTFYDDSFEAIADFETAARAITLEPGRGAVGRVFETQKAEVITDLNFKGRARMNSSKGAGLKSGLVVPVWNTSNTEITAVLHFYSTRVLQQSEADYMSEDFTSLAKQMHAVETTYEAGPVLVESENTRASKHMNQEQMDLVYMRLREMGTFHASLNLESVDWFYNQLGLSNSYFDRFTPNEIARHISAYTSARSLNRNSIQISLPNVDGNGVVMMCNTRQFVYGTEISDAEQILDDLRTQTKAQNKCLSSSRWISNNFAAPYWDDRLAVYIVDVEDYREHSVDIMERDLSKITSDGFLNRSEFVLERYQNIIDAKLNQLRPYVERYEEQEDGTVPVVIGMRSVTDPTENLDYQSEEGSSIISKTFGSGGVRNRERGLNTIITELLGEKLIARRKYMNTLSNGLIFYNLYLENKNPDDDAEIERFLDRIGLLSILPRSDLINLLIDQTFTANEYAYTLGATNFAFYFLENESEDLNLLRDALKRDPVNAGRLERISANLSRAALSVSRIDETVRQYPDLMKQIFKNFSDSHDPEGPKNTPEFSNELKNTIEKEVFDELDRKILYAFLSFNQNIEKTNFYVREKSTLSYRLNTKFIDENSIYPMAPYGIFMILSNEFRGFHVRFREVARGGLRLIPSRDAAAYTKNRESLFTENYNLAYTQNKKNKDIPEFGSKGTILLERNCQQSGNYAFSKYISGLFDVILPSPNGRVVDHHGKEELIFCGPDEGTADVMEWAAFYGKGRGYPYWKAFTTGKPNTMGGIPHDTYGMTTRSVHEYVVGTLDRLGIDESTVTKMQTGGPDGDLGSNEILISKDNTIGIVDGSGTLMDPNGIDREEMTRLATERLMVEHFDKSKLSKDGALILVNETDVTLPDGSIVDNGLTFRNNFHMSKFAKADLFVPCGGRPESINAGNVKELFDENGNCMYKYIVEGANLFITEDARATLEEQGVILFKDASTNKGGVTSSSMEVLAALCMTDEEHSNLMQVKNGEFPDFYNRYVEEVIMVIEENARLEFNCLWIEHERTGEQRAVLTDVLSTKINDLNVDVQNSSLWNNIEIRKSVLTKAFPKTLQDEFGLDTLLERLPEDYVKSVFGYYIASRFVYKYGLDGAEFSFFEYMNNYTGEEL